MREGMYWKWYERVYPQLAGHGLWLRGGEINTLPLEELKSRAYRILFTRLSTYFDTADSFTHSLLYQLAASVKGVFPDLAYLPPKQDVRIFAADSVPWLLGTNSKLGPESFHLIGISNSTVQELINLPSILRHSRIPLSKKDRMQRPGVPLIILGGANALYSGVLWNEDGWADGVFVGESDADIRKLLEVCRDGHSAGAGKLEILGELQKVPGFILPEAPRRTRKSFISDLNASQPHIEGPVSYSTDQIGSGEVQLSEGCPCFCSFCAESWDRKPYRERSGKEVARVALQAKARRGLDQLDLYSFNFNMHSDFYRILWDLAPSFRGIGLKSQRFDILAHDPQMTEFQHAIEKASFTCGLEGISKRLRNYLQKSLQPEDLQKSLASIFRSKCRELKVFLIATGLEEEEDFRDFDEFLESLKRIRNAQHSSARIIFSMTPLVRFPWTPLEFENAFETTHYEKIIRKASQRVRHAGFEFREAAELSEYWVSQVLVRASDSRIAGALLKAVQSMEFVYYRNITDAFRAEFEKHLIAGGIVPENLLKGTEPEDRNTKPWSHVETGVRPEFLLEQLKLAREFAATEYCLGRNWTSAKCLHCGGCPTRFHVRDIVLAKQARPFPLERFKERVSAARKSEREVTLRVHAGQASRGLPRKMLGVAVARALMLYDERFTPDYRGFRRSFWEGDEVGSQATEIWIEGDDLLTLSWNEKGIPLLQAALADPAKLAQINSQMGEWGQILGVSPSIADTSVAFSSCVTLTLTASFAAQPERYLKSHDLKHTLRKFTTDPAQASPSYSFDFVPQALKKGYLSKLQLLRKDPAIVTLTPGPKFRSKELVEFCKEAFNGGAEEWVRIRCEAKFSGRQ